MARPTKQGVDYFPVDCEFDNKTELYLIEMGAAGMSVLIRTWQMIYSGEGYFIKNNDDFHLLLTRKTGLDIGEIRACLHVCLARNIFNKDIHDAQGVLTSRALQSRFFIAARKKKVVDVDARYLLVDVVNYTNLAENGRLLSANPAESGRLTDAGNDRLTDISGGDNSPSAVSGDGNPVIVAGNATKEEVDVEEEVKEEVDVDIPPAEKPAFRRSRQDLPISQDFAPDEQDYRIMESKGLNRKFIDALLAEFIKYWTDEGTPHTNWKAKFRNRAIEQWLRKSVATSKQPSGDYSDYESDEGFLRDAVN